MSEAQLKIAESNGLSNSEWLARKNDWRVKMMRLPAAREIWHQYLSNVPWVPKSGMSKVNVISILAPASRFVVPAIAIRKSPQP